MQHNVGRVLVRKDPPAKYPASSWACASAPVLAPSCSGASWNGKQKLKAVYRILGFKRSQCQA